MYHGAAACYPLLGGPTETETTCLQAAYYDWHMQLHVQRSSACYKECEAFAAALRSQALLMKLGLARCAR